MICKTTMADKMIIRRLEFWGVLFSWFNLSCGPEGYFFVSCILLFPLWNFWILANFQKNPDHSALYPGDLLPVTAYLVRTLVRWEFDWGSQLSHGVFPILRNSKGEASSKSSIGGSIAPPLFFFLESAMS